MADRKFTNYGAVSARDHMEGQDVGRMKSRSSVISRSTISGEQAFESASTRNKRASPNLVFEGNSKCCEYDSQPSDIIDSTCAILVKSDFSTETRLPHSNFFFEMDAKKTQVNDLNAFEDGFITRTHDSQHRTESSCSNSLPVILPVSLSKHSYQKTFKEAYSFRNYSGSLSSSNSKGFDHRMEESVTASLESGESEAAKSKPIEMDPEVMEKINNGFQVNVSSEFSVTRPDNVSVKDEVPFVAGFDLNKDMNTIEMDDFIKPIVETASSHSVIHVVAKAGIPRGLPMTPLKFRGALGWKGSSDLSAFHCAVLPKRLDEEPCSRNYSTEDPLGFTGIDLNLAVVEDSSAVGLVTECEERSSVLTFQDSPSEVRSKRADSLSIDLNSLYDAADEYPQPYLPAKSESLSLMDLNLNANALAGNNTCKNDHWLNQCHQSLENKTSDSTNKGKQDFKVTFNPCLTNLSLIPVLNHDHAPQYLVAVPNIVQPQELIQIVAPLQPRLPYLSHALPPLNYPSRGPFYSGAIPYVRHPYEHYIFPELLNRGTVSSVQSPHSVQVAANEQSSSDVTNSPAPMVDVKADDKLSTSQSKMDEAREFIFLAKNTPIDEHIKSMHQEAWFSSSMKRKEPEGGLDYYHRGFRKVI